MSSERSVVQTADAPEAVGPYSQAIRHGDLLVCSGQVPLDPASGEVVGETAAEQAAQCLKNLEAVCAAAGTSLGRALRLTVYTTDLGQFAAINEAYSAFFSEAPPARAAVEVSALPKGSLVEIDAIVIL